MVVRYGVRVTGRSSFMVAKGLRIGQNCLISWDVQVMDTDFHKILSSEGQQVNKDKEIVIGDNVWIGSRCNILKDAIIPDGSVIASNSLISKKLVERNCIYGGLGKIIKTDIKWVP